MPSSEKENQRLHELLDEFGIDPPANASLLDAKELGTIELRRGDPRSGASQSTVEPASAVSGRLAQKHVREVSAKPSSDETRAKMAEVDACLRLSWIATVDRPKAARGPTPDFELDGLNVEVYCPQEHSHEREVVRTILDQDLAKASGPVKVAVAVGHMGTGSGRRVDSAGRVQHDPESLALAYPANKLIDRLLNAKRDSTQFLQGNENVLWLDLKHGLRQTVGHCTAVISTISRDPSSVGMIGIWHGFYGRRGAALLKERTTLEYGLRPQSIYGQQREGFFRERPEVSAAVLSTIDGVVLFENPWADRPLGGPNRRALFRLMEFRPEFSFWDHAENTLRAEIESQLNRIESLVRGRSESSA